MNLACPKGNIDRELANMNLRRQLLLHLHRSISPSPRLSRGAVLLAVFAFCSGALAAEFEQGEDSWLDDEPEFLRVDEAFLLSTEEAADRAILAYWEIADG